MSEEQAKSARLQQELKERTMGEDIAFQKAEALVNLVQLTKEQLNDVNAEKERLLFESVRSTCFFLFVTFLADNINI